MPRCRSQSVVFRVQGLGSTANTPDKGILFHPCSVPVPVPALVPSEPVAILAQGSSLAQDGIACACSSVLWLVCIGKPQFMGRNRKWVLEGKLSEAVWRTILRGPRPPGALWPRVVRNNSPTAKSAKPVAAATSSSPKKGKGKGQSPGKESPFRAQVKMSNQKTETHQAPRREPMSPDEVKATARKRVEKLEAALLALREGDDMFPVLQEGLKKARAQAQERPVSERIHATKLFLERKRVEAARQSTMKAREELAACLAAQEKEEALLADGEQRLVQLLLEEKNNPSPFRSPPLPPVVADAKAELLRMQTVIDDLQRDLVRLRGGPPADPAKTTIRWVLLPSPNQ